MTARRFQSDFKSKGSQWSDYARDLTNFLSVFIADVRNLFDHGVTVSENLNAEIQDATFTPNQPLVIQATTTKGVKGAQIIETGGVNLKQYSVRVSGNTATINAIFESASPVKVTVYLYGN